MTIGANPQTDVTHGGDSSTSGSDQSREQEVAPRVSQALYVLDEIGFVRLDGAMADDLSVANAARVSFGKRKEALDEGDEKLIAFLMRERHGTPFEHNAFRFHVKAPIFVTREWQRHRIGSFNERSGRYSEFQSEFYVPAPDNVRSQVGKPGNYTFEHLDEELADRAQLYIASQSDSCFDMYESLLGLGVAKEQARLVLPVNLYTEFYWTVNARSLINFLSLRTAEAAMFEIRSFAWAVEHCFHSKMPVTHRCWDELGRHSI